MLLLLQRLLLQQLLQRGEECLSPHAEHVLHPKSLEREEKWNSLHAATLLLPLPAVAATAAAAAAAAATAAAVSLSPIQLLDGLVVVCSESLKCLLCLHCVTPLLRLRGVVVQHN